MLRPDPFDFDPFDFDPFDFDPFDFEKRGLLIFL